jgi:energy-converting hydrogenase Eha subunit H
MKMYKKNETKFSKKPSLILAIKKAQVFKVADLRDFQILIFKIGVATFSIVSVIYMVWKVSR